LAIAAFCAIFAGFFESARAFALSAAAYFFSKARYATTLFVAAAWSFFT